MISFSQLLTTVLAASATSLAAQPCQLLGPTFPAPKNLSQSKTFSQATANLSQFINNAVADAKTSANPSFNANSTSFAVSIFSANEPDPVFKYFYSAPSLANATGGVKKVDEDTIFRIGSISKLWTVFLFLVEAGDVHFHDPITKWVPELRTAAAATAKNTTAKPDVIDHVSWNDVTIGELASQLSGIGRDYGFSDSAGSQDTMVNYGFPPLPASQIPPCGLVAPCDRAHFFKGFTNSHPVFPTSATPIYSNAAFQVVAYALEAIANQTYESSMTRSIIKPLNLSHSSVSVPNRDENGIIPGNATTTYWNVDVGDEAPAGGLYSSAKDLSTLGRSILNSSLIPAALTRRWLKPYTHTASIAVSVGAPWEIFRVQHDDRVIDLYTKSGDIGAYSSLLALSPDHQVGFTILAAGVTPQLAAQMAADAIASIIVPALEDTAREQADDAFSGTYTASGNTNSSITLTTDDRPGLKVSSWISNSTSVPGLGESFLGLPSDIAIRLYPTNLRDGSKVAFRALFDSVTGEVPSGPFSQRCALTWASVDGLIYGNVGWDEFLFELDAKGKAVSIEPRAMRIRLQKE